MDTVQVQTWQERYANGWSLKRISAAHSVASETVRDALIGLGVVLRPRVPVVPKDAPVSAHRRWKIRKVFGISMDRYLALMDRCGGRCEICREGPSGRYRELAIDHDHITGGVRGLLCHKCNMALGQLETRIDAARAYLAKVKE